MRILMEHAFIPQTFTVSLETCTHNFKNAYTGRCELPEIRRNELLLIGGD